MGMLEGKVQSLFRGNHVRRLVLSTHSSPRPGWYLPATHNRAAVDESAMAKEKKPLRAVDF